MAAGKKARKSSSTPHARQARSAAAIPHASRSAERDTMLAGLKESFEKHGIRHVKLGATDVDGVFRGKYVSPEKFFSAAAGGLGFCDVVFGWDLADELYDNARVTGWHTGYPDAHARIDLTTFRIIPWEPDTAAFVMDFVNRDGTPFEPSPRQLLQRVTAQARAQGFVPRMGAEFEYFIFRETPQSARAKGFRDLEHLTPGMFGYSWLRSSANAELVHAILDGCQAFGIPVEGMHTETGPGVYETAILYDDAERAADKAALFKTVVKEICARRGLIPCFMAKPSARLPGCSGHVHQSLWAGADGGNVFHDARGEHGMSKLFRHYIGGILELLPEFTALYWPTINSYKRSVAQTWAPTTATWGLENRTTALRVIGDSPKSTRVECRFLAADMNPYVGMAATLAAGLWGIANEVEPGAICAGDGYAVDAAPLPRNLRDATALLARSRRARPILGEGFVDHYVRTREWEVRQFERAVTTWELERYLELV
jgi:glutamine synthetase